MVRSSLSLSQGLSTVVTTNNLRTRRNLRGDFERRSVNLSVELCESFSHVNQLVEKLSSEVEDFIQEKILVSL